MGEADEAQVSDVGERINVEIGEAQKQRGGRGQDEEKQDRRERRRRHRPARTRFAGPADRFHSVRPFSSIQRRFSSSSEERRVGKECVSTWRSRGAPYH